LAFSKAKFRRLASPGKPCVCQRRNTGGTLRLVTSESLPTEGDPIRVLAIAGSLRKGSVNKALVRVAVQVAPPTVIVEDFGDLDGIPLFNEDIEKDAPARVKLLKAKIAAADALLIATPEYNYSIPGVLKNAIDWASRPAGDNSFEDKPVAVMSGAGGTGGSRAQLHLRQVFVYLNMHPINRPQVAVTAAKTKLDPSGEFTDPAIRDSVKQLLVALDAWTRRLKRR
jgi:chromate reductase, NAD(P)H dehydrogenase (quinone)